MLAWHGVTRPADLLAQSREVVVVYGERRELPGLALFDEGLSQVLAASDVPVQVFREELDLSRLDAPGYAGRIADQLAAKYADRDVDVVVTVLQGALDFVLDEGARAFGGAPVVFGGVTPDAVEDRALPRRVTGVVLKREFAPTVELALRLQPATTRLVLVGGSSLYGRRLRDQALREVAELEGRVAIDVLPELPLEAMLERLAVLPPDAVVLYLTVLRDGAGEAFVPYEVAQRVAQSSSVPVYASVDQYLGTGAVGGVMYAIEDHAAAAAGLALEILDGADPAGLPIRTVSPRVTLVDGRELRRWGLTERDLPADAQVRFRPFSLWREYRRQVIGVVVLLAIQAALIGGLLTHRVRRRRAEVLLHESEARFSRVADAAPVVIWKSDADKVLTFVSRAWVDFAGPEESRGLVSTELVHADDRERWDQIIDDAFVHRTEFNAEARLRRVDGVYRWVLCHGVPRFDDDGAFLGFTGSCTDVTRLKEMELEKQHATAQAAHLMRVATLGELASSIAHELNQPLGAILSNAQAAQLLLASEVPNLDAVRDIVDDICDDDRRASDILRGIRGLVRKHEAQQKPIVVNEMVEHILHIVNIEAEARSSTLAFEPGRDLPTVLGDPVHLRQVLMNLVMNGLDAVSEVPVPRREVVVRTRRGRSDGPLTISVADSGQGVAPELLNRVFEPFFTTKDAGLGLGLSICRSIVTAHGGRLWCESEPESGTAFHVELPVMAPESGPAGS